MQSVIPWIVGALVIIMVIGPIFMFRPSPGQKRLARLRTHAASLGLMVRIEQTEQGDRFAAYTLPWQRADRKAPTSFWQLSKQNMAHELHFHGRWHWQGREPSLSESAKAALRLSIDQLPQNSQAMSCQRVGLSAVWDERCEQGDEKQAVEQLNAVLLRLAEAL